MQLQKLPNYNLCPPSSSFHCTLNPPSSIQQRTRLVWAPHSQSGFRHPLEMVPTSQTCLRKHGGLVEFRCQASKDDGFYMRKAVELARKAIGCTSPNPMVGCVIVKDGNIIGQGFHPKAGQPHAEVFALRDAGDLAENATAYVSLEPCNHYGRTPPCTEALIKAKVKKVVVGMVDPNPIVASKGVDKLREAGIEVTVGVEEELCKRLNEAYIHQMLTGKPFVTLRYSMSVNGHILDQLGEGVTGSGGYYSRLLQEYDAIILSPASLDGKFYLPASQEFEAKQPLKIVTATTSSSPIQINGFTAGETSQVIIFTDNESAVKPETSQKGIETVVLDSLNLNAILEYCKSQGMCSVLIDLRGSVGNIRELLKEGIQQNLLQKIIVEVLPQWDGSVSDDGNSLVESNILGKRLNLKKLQPKIANQSVVLEGYF